MPALKSVFIDALRRLPISHQRSKQYTTPISPDDLTAEYLLIEIPEDLSSAAEGAVTTLLTETHRNGLTTELTDSEGYPSLFPPGASLFDTDGSTSRLQDILSVLDRFAHVFRRYNTNVVVLNAARIEENIRIAEHDPGKSGLIAQQNIDALASCLNALSDDQYGFVDSDAVPAASRDSHLVRFREAILYR
ncbi:hypothetical protein [Halalkalicoccus jeotgali]|uniref:Uncharacterized protein n=1 Tax=Halalkalicoccus jeotgali (strain DSM 18796 / CECT 7217 / JCM 14584 / KCTC 4019 / B3) TaxID=795797 RepID=D8JBE0_HALJB|nr:hypothetical protein [Halalkalicoccus jeotgali]ADJ16593.1 hypothetical protein HacjB3_16176 [Halalkalicoccus jeotgali B3]ELY41310.1 hypothetical protein C497_01070 [Halalkalicoccus jeotgali B3]